MYSTGSYVCVFMCVYGTYMCCTPHILIKFVETLPQKERSNWFWKTTSSYNHIHIPCINIPKKKTTVLSLYRKKKLNKFLFEKTEKLHTCSVLYIHTYIQIHALRVYNVFIFQFLFLQNLRKRLARHCLLLLACCYIATYTLSTYINVHTFEEYYYVHMYSTYKHFVYSE